MGLRSYRAVNTVAIIKTNQLMLHGVVIAFLFEIHTKRVSIPCEQNVEFLSGFAKLRKVTINFSCLSVRPHGTTRLPLDEFS
jgi:hypothetical protein